VIRSFFDGDTKAAFDRQLVKRFEPFQRVALRKLTVLNNARSLHDLKGPGFSLEALKDDRKGQHSIRMSDKWRICFVWSEGDAERVEITDYH
jgi:proteic killer suppression protein